MTLEPPRRAGRPAAASSVAFVASGYERSLRPCSEPPIAPRRRSLIPIRVLSPLGLLPALAAVVLLVPGTGAARPARALAADDVALGSVLPGLEALDAGLLDPPDVQVAAGPGAVMELTNGAGRIWRT